MKIYAIGLGPGSVGLLSPQAEKIIKSCDVIAGYTTYLKLFPELFADKEIIGNGMRGELKRCREALEASLQGKKVAVISSGDAGIYGMAGLLLELIEEDRYSNIELEIIPGITAASAAGALLGAPLMNDFCVLSLSDLMTPAEVIMKRIKAAAAADLVTVLYNPAGKKRRELLSKTIDCFRQYLAPDAPVGIVHDASRENESYSICKISDFPFDEIDMTSLLVIGNSNTIINNNRMYTRRGYIEKYGR